MDSGTRQIEEHYRADGPALLRYIRRCGGGNRSEDLLHETFVRALERPERVRNARWPRAWIYGVARHVVFESLRRHSRIVELTIDPPAPATPEEDVRMIQVKSAMSELPANHQEVLRLRLDAELSYEEIATALDIPVGTVRSRLHHAVRKLRAALGGKEMEYE